MVSPSDYLTPRYFQLKIDCENLRIAIESTTSSFGRHQAIRSFYEKNEDLIFKAGYDRWAFSYPIDWNLLLNPIEMEAWCAIRSIGMVILYPQYPAGKYMLDFGNPVNKIGLEIDGKKYHDKEKDLIRDTELKSMGWKIYRITGKEMYFVDSAFYNSYDNYNLTEDEIEKIYRWHYLHTGEGVIESIREIHFLKREQEGFVQNLMEETLQNHKLI